MQADEGKTIKVRVSFTDDANFPESLTSAAAAAVTASTYGQFIWAATLTVALYQGSYGYSSFVDIGDLEPAEFSYNDSPAAVQVLAYSGNVFHLQPRRNWSRGATACSWARRSYSLARPAEIRRDTPSQTTA